MPTALKVPVEVPPDIEGSEDPDQLSIKINQIFLQKGPFRNVTEQSVASGPDIDESDSDDDVKSEQSDKETREERLELLAKTRQELFDTIRRGTLQCNEALDFISLLLSKHSKTAASTFSPALKEAVQPGMLDGVYLDNARYAPTIRPKQDLAKGWRTQGFLSATDMLRIASRRLKREADSQSSYWTQAAELGHDGWKVCRHPANRRQLGVMLGMPESAPQFRNQGFVTLQQENGSIQLARQSNRKRVSVAISRDGQMTARHTPEDSLVQDKSKLLQELTAARDYLIDEELFHELAREARLAANQGIITRGEDIEFSISDRFSVRISLDTPITSSQASPSEDDDLARFIGFTLRSLLIQAHHENYIRRSRPPPPISTKPAQTPEYAILRPLIAALRHGIAKAEFERRLQREFIAPLRKAGIDVSMKKSTLTQEPSDTAQPAHPFTDSNQPDLHSIIPVQPQRDSWLISSPMKTWEIQITTYLGRPLYGVTYEIIEERLDSYQSFNELRSAIERRFSARLNEFVAQDGHLKGWTWEADSTFKGVRGSPNNGGAPDVFIRYTLADGVMTARVHGGRMNGTTSKRWSFTDFPSADAQTHEQRQLIDLVREAVRGPPEEVREDLAKLGVHQ